MEKMATCLGIKTVMNTREASRLTHRLRERMQLPNRGKPI